MSNRIFALVAAGVVYAHAQPATAGTISVEGRCAPLTHISQMGPLIGQARFDEGPTSGSVPANQYSAQGFTFRTETLTDILPGVTTRGTGHRPNYRPNNPGQFPAPIGGGGSHQNQCASGGTGLFDVEVHQFGLTLGTNQSQRIVAWDENGELLGQITLTPSNDASFFGIDCGALAIKMIHFGDDDAWNGDIVESGGNATYSDNWVWSGHNVCGNGVVNAGEECDDGNVDGTDVCTSICRNATCGDSYVRAGTEECDDGNSENADDCIDTCKNPTCGDGYVWWTGGEQCEDGNTDETDACAMCREARCGDGFVRAGMEACDDGNTSNYDACLQTCEVATCGDGFVHIGVEQCDDGNLDSDDECTDTCRITGCGDGVLDSDTEECDDGNDIGTDACAMCKPAICGDGFVQAGVEECDDGNDVETDDCLNDCTSTVGDETDGGTTTDSGASTGGSGAGSSSDTGGSTTAGTTGVPSTTGVTTAGGQADPEVGCMCRTNGRGSGRVGLLALIVLGAIKKRPVGASPSGRRTEGSSGDVVQRS